MSFFRLHWRHLGVTRAAPRRAPWERLGCSPWPWPGRCPALAAAWAVAWPWPGRGLALAWPWPWSGPGLSFAWPWPVLWLVAACGCAAVAGAVAAAAVGSVAGMAAVPVGGLPWLLSMAALAGGQTLIPLCKYFANPATYWAKNSSAHTRTCSAQRVCFLSKTASGVTIFFCFVLFSRKALDGKK